MVTLDQAREAWKAEFPFGSPGYERLSQAEYDAVVEDMAPLRLNQMERQEAANTAASLSRQLQDFRKDVQTAHDMLGEPVLSTTTDAIAKLKQTRAIVDGIVTRLDQLVDLLVRRGMI